MESDILVIKNIACKCQNDVPHFQFGSSIDEFVFNSALLSLREPQGEIFNVYILLMFYIEST